MQSNVYSTSQYLENAICFLLFAPCSHHIYWRGVVVECLSFIILILIDYRAIVRVRTDIFKTRGKYPSLVTARYSASAPMLYFIEHRPWKLPGHIVVEREARGIALSTPQLYSLAWSHLLARESLESKPPWQTYGRTLRF